MDEDYDMAPLVAVYDHLPQSSSGYYPLLIGLGPLAEEIVDTLPTRLTIPDDVGIYRSGNVNSPSHPNHLEEWLANTACVLVIVDAKDALACEQAKYWSKRLADAEVYFHTTLVLNYQTSETKPELLAPLLNSSIVVREHDACLSQINTTLALLPCVPFMQRGLVCYDVADLRSLLDQGTRATTTAIRWWSSDQSDLLIKNTFSLLDEGRCISALFCFNGGMDMTLDEIVQITDLADDYFSPEVVQGVLATPSNDFMDGERILNITLVFS